MTLTALSAPASMGFTHVGVYGHDPDERPMVEVELAVTTPRGLLIGRPVRTLVLVDSGADITMLDGGLASTLGLDLAEDRYPKSGVGGVGLGEVPVARATVKADLCGMWREVPVNFTLKSMTHPQLLGRLGAFDALVVGFWHARRAVLASAA